MQHLRLLFKLVKLLLCHLSTCQQLLHHGARIAPLHLLLELRKLLEGDRMLTFSIGDKMCRMISEEFTLDTKLIEGSYPNYRLVIPASFKQEIELTYPEAKVESPVFEPVVGCAVLRCLRDGLSMEEIQDNLHRGFHEFLYI